MRIMIKKFHRLKTNVKKSIADQIKLLSWVLGGLNGLSTFMFGGFLGLVFSVIWWGSFQFLAHYILQTLEIEENKE